MDARAGIESQLRTLFNDGALGPLSDADLLERFASREGDAAEAAFAALVDRHGPAVLGVCRRVLGDPHEAEDAFQATFLVLARKADAIGRRERLAGWLYGVARRTALKLRAGSARRRRHERDAATAIEATHAAEDRGELRAVLDEEIARLPEKYRNPVVLCHLEGVSRAEASRRLRCPENTINVRLLRARGRLRERLTRRGFAPMAALLAAGLWPEAASAALPSGLAESTAVAAMQFATGGAGLATGAVSVRAVVLAKGILKAMNMTRWKAISTGALAALALATGAGVLAQKATTAEPAPKVAARPVPQAEAPGPETPWKKTLPGGETIELIGISTQPAGPKSWWGPDGLPLEKAPFDGLAPTIRESDDRKARVFAIRGTSPKGGTDISINWEIPEATGVSNSNPRWQGGEHVGILAGATAALKKDAKAATIRLGVSAGAWKTELTTAGGGLSSTESDKGQITFARARATPNGCSIVVADTIKAPAIRILAIDPSGSSHVPSSLASTSSGPFRMSDMEFAHPLEGVREFHFQTRKTEWIEIRDVPLEPREAAAKP